MANPSISIDDDVMEEFDKIREAKAEEMGDGAKLPRSAVIEQLMKGWISENRDVLEQGNRDPAEVLAD